MSFSYESSIANFNEGFDCYFKTAQICVHVVEWLRKRCTCKYTMKSYWRPTNERTVPIYGVYIYYTTSIKTIIMYALIKSKLSDIAFKKIK